MWEGILEDFSLIQRANLVIQVIRWEDTNINKFTYENCEVYILDCGVGN
jgi:hypothetical protein